MLFPAIGENTRLDDLFDDDFGAVRTICHHFTTTLDETVRAPAYIALEDEFADTSISGVMNLSGSRRANNDAVYAHKGRGTGESKQFWSGSG